MKQVKKIARDHVWDLPDFSLDLVYEAGFRKALDLVIDEMDNHYKIDEDEYEEPYEYWRNWLLSLADKED